MVYRFLLMAVVCVASHAAMARDGVMQPHKAVYELSLSQARQASAITNISGTLEYVMADTCDAWVVNQQMMMKLSSRTGDVIDRKGSLASWERKDGREYRFTSRHSENGVETEFYKGVAKKYFFDAEAKYETPDNIGTVKLPREVVFPTAHTVEMLKRARDKTEIFTMRMFDGNDDKGQMDLTAALSPWHAPAAPVPDELKNSEALQGQTAPARIGFFEVDQVEAEPEYEMILELHQNGIAREMAVDYGDFTMLARLKTLDVQPLPTCP